MNKFKKIFKNTHGTALLMTLLILTGILVVSLVAADLVVSGLKMSRAQQGSTKAYFAAEAGIERALWEVRKNSYALPAENQDNVFSGDLGNDSSYSVNYATSTPNVFFTSIGSFGNTKRSVQVNFQP